MKSVKRSLRKCIGRASLHLDELNTLMIQVESVINSRPLTYVHDDIEGISYPLCPSHLLYGRRMLITANGLHSEVISTYETLTRRAKHHHLVISQFVKRWRNEYQVNLRESYSIKRKHKSIPKVKEGDVVILKNESTKHAFWKLAIIESLIVGQDGVARATIVKAANSEGRPKSLRRSVKHLFPLEINFQSTVRETSVSREPDTSDATDSSVRSFRPRRMAAVTGEMLRRLNKN